MKLIIKYNANRKGYELEADLDAESEPDAEALGYATMVLFKAAEFLARYSKNTKPELHERVKKGVNQAAMECSLNPNWPFDTTITHT